MRKWTGWYTKGFRGSAAVRGALARVETVGEMSALLRQLDPNEPFPRNALRAGRAKGGRKQRVSLPPGYLENREDDTPPKSPHGKEEMEAWERALQSG
jgi:hypothetical protein